MNDKITGYDRGNLVRGGYPSPLLIETGTDRVKRRPGSIFSSVLTRGNELLPPFRNKKKRCPACF